MLEADTLAGLPKAPTTTVLPGDGSTGIKDPVIFRDENGWHLWASCHPLDDPAATDRMTTEHLTSSDGLQWIRQDVALRGRTGDWDARGVRFAEVLLLADGFLALYDGRASAAQNFQERTGAAVADSLGGPWRPAPGPVFVSPFGAGGLRYLCSVVDSAGGRRVYYESALADGSHELRTQLLTAGDVHPHGSAPRTGWDTTSSAEHDRVHESCRSPRPPGHLHR